MRELEREWQKKLQISPRSTKPVTDIQLDKAREDCDECFDLWKTKWTVEASIVSSVEVRHGFDLSEIMKEWRVASGLFSDDNSDDATFLFKDLEKEDCGVWLKKWKLIFKGKGNPLGK
jgi:hypothetical protein